MPTAVNLRLKIPKAYASHQKFMESSLHGKKISIIVDETTDIRDKSVLNILFLAEEGQVF